MKLTDADIARLKAATRWTDEDLQLLAEAGLLDLLQQRDPAAEIAEYDRSTTLLGRIFNDLARGGASALANLQGAMALGSGDPVAVQRALEAAARVAEMPQRPVIRQMIEEADAAGGFWEGIAAGLKAASRDPLGAVAGLALESLPAQLPAYLAMILSRRPMVGAGAMGATSFLQEFGGALAEEAAKRGIDPNSPEVRQAVIEALADPTFLANAREHGAMRGAIIGLLDAVAARLAGQMLVPESVAKGPLAREAVNIAVAQPAAQMAAGAGGEALAQLATEGKVTSPGEVLAEALGELGGVPADVAVFGRERIADTIRKAAAEREARQERERAERAAKAQAALGPSEEDDAEAQRRAAIETILPFVPEAQGDPNFFAGWDDATLFTAQERIIRRRLAEMQSPMEGMPVPPDPPPPDAPVEAQKLYAAQMRAYAREVRDFYRRAVAARENALEHQKTFGEPIASTQAAQLQTAQQQPAANVIYQHPALGNIQLPAASPDAEAAQRGLAAVLEHALERQRVEQERQAVMREVLRKFDIAVPEGAQPLDVEELFEREIGTRVRRLAPDIELPKIDRNSSARVAQLRERNNAILRALPEVLTRQKAEARSAFKLADVYRRRIEDQADATIEIEGAPQPKKGVVRDPQAGGEPLGDANVRFVPVIGNYPVRPLRTARRQTSKGVTYTEYVFEAIDPRTGEPMRDKDGTPIILRISDPNDVRLVAYKIGPKNKDFISRAKGPADEKLSIPRAQSRVARVEDMGDEAAARGDLKGAYELGELIGEERDFGVFLARGAHTFEVRFGRRTTSGRWYAVGADQIPRAIRARLENAARLYMTKQRWMPEPPSQGEGASPGPDQPSPDQPSDNREAAALPSSTATSQREDVDEPRATEKEAEKEDKAAITAQPKQALPRPEPQPQQQPPTEPAEAKKQADTPQAAQPKETKPKTAQPQNEPAQKRRRTKQAKGEQTEPKPQRTGGLGPIAPGGIGPIPLFIDGGAGGLGGGLGGGGAEVSAGGGAGAPPVGADTPGIEIPPELMGATQQAPEKNASEGAAGGISAGRFYEDKAKWLKESINQIVSSDKPASFKLEKLFQLNSDIYSLRRGALYAAALFDLDQEIIKSFDQLIDLWHDAVRQVRETMNLPQQFEFVRLSAIKKPGKDHGVFNVYAHVDTVFKEDTTYSLDDVPLVTPVRDKSGIVIEESLANEPNIVELVLEVVKAADIDPRHVTVYKQFKEDRSLAGAIVLVDKGEKPSFRYILSINQAEWKRAQMIDRAAILAHEIGHCILAREQILKPEAVAALAEHGKKEIEQLMKRHSVFGISIYNLDGWMELSSKRIREMRTPPKDFNPATIEPYVRSFAEYFANMTMRYMIERSDRVFAGLPELARNLIRRAALLLTRFWARFRRFLLGDKSGSATGEAFREFLDKVVARHVAGMAAMANIATGQTTGAVEEASSLEIKAEGYRATIERIIDAQILDDQRHNIDKQLRDAFDKVNKSVLVPLKGAVARRRRNSRFIEEAPSSGNIEKWRSRLDAASQEIKDIINEAKDQYKPFRIYGVNDPITPVIEFDITNDRLHKLGFTSRAMITWQRDEYGYDVPHGKLRIMLPPGTPPIKDDVYKGTMYGVSGEYTIDVPLGLGEDWLDKFLDARAKFLVHMRNAGHILLAEPTDAGMKEQENLKRQLKELIDEKFGGNASAAVVAVQANKIGRDYVAKRLGISLADLEKFYSKDDWDSIISGVPFADSPVPVVRRIVHEMARLLPPEALQGEMSSDAVALARKLIELGREFGIHKSPDMQALAERVGAPEESEPDKENDEPVGEAAGEEKGATQTDRAAERAMVDAEKIDHEMLRGLQGNPDGSSSTFTLFFNASATTEIDTERAAFMDHNGHLTPEGVERIQAAVFARAYGDRRLVELMIEEREEPTIRNALLAVAADWALMREQGDPQYDITKQLIEAISLIRRSRTVPGGIRALLRQVDAFERRDPITELLARLFYNSDMSRLADQRTMIVRLQSYAASVLRRSQAVGDLFKDAPTTPQQILEAILRATQQSRGVTLYSNPIGPLAQLMYNTARDAARFFAGIAAPWVEKAFETPAGKWLRDAIKDTNAYLLSTGGPPFLDRTWRLLSTSTHEYARWIAEQYGSRIAIEKIVNVMGPRAGSVDIGDTYEEEVEREGTRYMRRWDQIVREARDAGVTDEEIVQALTRTGTVSDAAKRYAQRLRKLFDELHQHAVDAGIKMGYRADYFTRVLDPARVSEDYEGFVERAASLYRQNGLDAEAAKQAARELAHVIVTGGNYGVFDLHHTGSATPSIFRQREFGPDADRVLAPYYDRNLDAIGARYISALVKRAAFARRFGDDAQRLEGIFEEIRQELEKRGKGAIAYTRLRNEMVGYLRSVLGIGLSQSAWRVSALIRMFGTLMMLEKAVLASLVEPMIVAGRSGSLREGLRALRDTVRALRKNKRPPEIMDLALEAGIIAGDIADAILAQRWFGSDPLTRVESDVLTAYFRRIGLEQWTNASRIAATGAAVRFLNRIFSQRTNENVLLARELGLDYDQAAEFWAQKGLGSDPLYASLIIARSKDPIAEALRRAVHRFVNDVVISARRGDRPRWANTALGAVIFQFSAYSWGYGRRVLMRPLRLSQSGMPHMAMARYLALAFVPMLVAMAVMAYGIEDIKDELYGLTDKYYYGNRLTPVAKWERAVSRSGLFAGYDPIYQLMGSTRFEQDAAKLVFGPVPGMAVRGLGALRDVFFANAPETRTAERNVIRWMYDFLFEPTVNFALTGVQSPIAKGLASFVTVYGIPSLREPAVSAIAGPLHKPPRPIQGVLESVKLPHKERP